MKYMENEDRKLIDQKYTDQRYKKQAYEDKDMNPLKADRIDYRKAISDYIPVNMQEKSDKKIMLDYIDAFHQNILKRENKIAHMTSSALILNESLDKILMIHHNIYNTWTWTGGHADGDADMLTVAVKEAKEETGIINPRPLTMDIASVDIIPVYGHMKREEYVSAHLHLNTSFILIADENETLIVNEDETSGVRWIDSSRLQEYSNEPYLIGIYNKILKKARDAG